MKLSDARGASDPGTVPPPGTAAATDVSGSMPADAEAGSMPAASGGVPGRGRRTDRTIPWKHRIAVRQAGYVVALVCIIGLLLTVGQIVEDYFDHRSEIEHSTAQILDTIRQPAAQAAFMVDKPLAREVAAGLFAHEAVVEVLITTDYGETLAEVRRESPESSWLAEVLFGDDESTTMDLSVNPDEPTRVGTVAVTLDPLIIGNAFLKRAERALIYGLLRSTVLSLVIAIVFYRTLTKPLLTLIRSLDVVNPRRPNAVAIATPEGHDRDEIGQLVEATNQLLTDVEHNRQRLQLARRDAERMRRRAEAASEAKTRFLAAMSHELRTPLNAILGFSEMIRDQMLGPGGNPKYSDYARDIHGSGRHLLHLINEILDISKIEAGKMELSPQHLPLEELLHGTVRVVELRASANRLKLVTDIPGDLPTIWGDEQAVQQVVLNLLTNAVKFTPPGGTVTLAARVDGGMARISVADTGIGMSESELERAFVPFERADNRYQLSNENGGTGLGLALVQRLVEMHDGDVSITSAPNCGTTVEVVLPVHGPSSARAAAGDIRAATEPAVTDAAGEDAPPAPLKTIRASRRAA